MINFKCRCGRAIRTADENAGRKGKCPGCGEALVVPATEAKIITDVLQFSPLPANDKKDEHQPVFYGQTTPDEKDQPPERKIPFFIDVFLYPLNKSGLIMLAVFIGVPFTFRVFNWFMSLGMLSLPALLPFYLLVGIIAWMVKAVIFLYMFWYLAECVRSSAEGWIRAPETTAITPGIFEILWQVFEIVLCTVLFFAPAAVYYYHVRETDWKFLAILLSGTFFYPMAILSVIMFDSLTGLNPLVIIGSIFSTFFGYVLLAAFTALFAWSFLVIMRYAILFFAVEWAIIAVSIYLLMVGAHILGRFYYRYERKLNWDV
ncbi:MAG: hypothetical protein WC374_06280 [Phycisphaerae bacterium]|jgi:hypothetical protein